MCGAGCGILYEPGVPLEEISCPCGHGYWDVFQERFVSGDQIRAEEAPSKADYEKLVRQSFSPEEYIARMRAQYITHLNSCETKKAKEEDIRQKGGTVDTSTAERSARELGEIERGDFTSRGLSGGDRSISTSERAEQEETQKPTSARDAPSSSTRPQLPMGGAATAAFSDDLPSLSVVVGESYALPSQAEERRTATDDQRGGPSED